MKKRILFSKIIFILIIVIIILFLQACPSPYLVIDGEKAIKISTIPEKEWTFIIYLDGANNLEQYAIEDFNEMEYGLYKASLIDKGILNKINIIVLFDRIAGEFDMETTKDGSDWTNTRIYKIKSDSDSDEYGYFVSDWIINDINDPGSYDVNMGDPDTLSWFINYAKYYFPAKNYALILWDHGGGARAAVLNDVISSTTKAIIWDEESTDQSNYYDALYLDEVQQALSKEFDSNNKLSILGMDACLMGTVEVAYEFSNLAKYFIASMAEEQGDGWNYVDILEKIVSYNGISLFDSSDQPKYLAELLVDSYHDSTENYSDQTLTSVDLSNIENLKTAIDNFAFYLDNEGKKSAIETAIFENLKCFGGNTVDDEIGAPYFDLYKLCDLIINDTSNGFSSGLKNAASIVIDKLGETILKSYAGSTYGGYYDIGLNTKRGLSIFISRGYKTNSNESYYAYQWWYTNLDTSLKYGKTYLYGNIDFCDYDSDSTVETWKELFEAWYDASNSITADTY